MEPNQTGEPKRSRGRGRQTGQWRRDLNRLWIVSCSVREDCGWGAGETNRPWREPVSVGGWVGRWALGEITQDVESWFRRGSAQGSLVSRISPVISLLERRAVVLGLWVDGLKRRISTHQPQNATLFWVFSSGRTRDASREPQNVTLFGRGKWMDSEVSSHTSRGPRPWTAEGRCARVDGWWWIIGDGQWAE